LYHYQGPKLYIQEDGAEYKLTVGVDIEDKAGNPMISGTSDTAIFYGSGEAKPSEDADAPQLMNIEPVDSTHLILTFNETVVLGIDPSENFNIVAEEDATVELDVLGVELGPNDDGVEDAMVVLTTSEQEARSYILVVIDLEDFAGNKTSSAQANGMFDGIGDGSSDNDSGDDTGDDSGDDTGDDTGDTTEDSETPKDASGFAAKAVFDAGKYLVTLSWINSIESVGDTIDQVIYLSKDKGGNYSQKGKVDGDEDKYEISGLSPGEYWFKLTQKDTAGNESEGVTTKIILGDTGPGVLGLLVVSVGLGRVISRRRRK